MPAEPQNYRGCEHQRRKQRIYASGDRQAQRRRPRRTKGRRRPITRGLSWRKLKRARLQRLRPIQRPLRRRPLPRKPLQRRSLQKKPRRGSRRTPLPRKWLRRELLMQWPRRLLLQLWWRWTGCRRCPSLLCRLPTRCLILAGGSFPSRPSVAKQRASSALLTSSRTPRYRAATSARAMLARPRCVSARSAAILHESGYAYEWPDWGC